MPAGNVFDFPFSGPNGLAGRVSLGYSYADYAPPDISFALTINDGLHVAEVTARADLQTREIRIAFFHVPSLACILGCGVAGIAGPLIECFDIDPAVYIACLQTKGLSIGGGIIGCVIGCAGGP